jgi:hypothetical protein
MNERLQNSKRRPITLDTDWMSAVEVAFLFVFSCFSVISYVVGLFQGRFPPVSYSTVIVAVGAIYVSAVSDLGNPIRVGAVAWAIGTALRVIAYYLHAPADLQRLAGINEGVCRAFGCILFSLAAVLWFRKIARR